MVSSTPNYLGLNQLNQSGAQQPLFDFDDDEAGSSSKDGVGSYW